MPAPPEPRNPQSDADAEHQDDQKQYEDNESERAHRNSVAV
jgi:hypothetical protein